MARTTIRTEDITASEVTTAKMATDPTNASNLSSGSVPAAQLGNVDTGGLRNDISTLALHSAIADNKAAFNLTNAFIDQYEDATGVDTTTDVERSSSGEYYASIIPGSLQTSWELDTGGDNTTITSTAGTNAMAIHSSTGEYTGAVIKKDFDFGDKDVKVRFYQVDSSGNSNTDKYMAMTVVASTGTTATYTDVDNDNDAGSTGFFGYINGTTGTGPADRDQIMENGTVSTGLGVTAYNNQSSNSVAGASSQIFSYYDGGGGTNYYGGEFFYDASADTFLITFGITGVNTSTGAFTAINTDHRLTVTSLPSTGKFYLLYGGANSHTGVRFSLNPNGVTPTNGVDGQASATGNYTSTTETANATVSKMGIVVLYKNAYGTATLDTDLIVQVSADGGSNYTSAPLTAAGTFSTGILSAKSNDITISNTGTAPKYKISFANQSEGVKETQVHGVALLY